MGLVSSIFGELKTRIESEWAIVTFDANLNEVFTSTHQVTDHPVEDGSDVSDHVIKKPKGLQLDGLITNTPASLIDAISALSTRAEDEYAKLEAMDDDEDLVTVFTSKREYENMIITNLVRTRNAGVGEGVSFSMTLKEIKKVQSEVVAAAPKRDAKQSKKPQGKKPPAPPDAAQDRTLTAKAADGLRALVGL